MPPLLTLLEVQAHLRVSRATVRRLISRGQLPIVKIGRRTFVTRQAVVAFLQQAQQAQTQHLHHEPQSRCNLWQCKALQHTHC